MDFDLILQQINLNTALTFPLQNLAAYAAPRVLPDSAPRLLRVFIRPPAKFRQSFAYFSAIL